MKKGKPRFAPGPAVDAGDTLETGESFRGIDEFKRLVLARPEPVVRGLAEKLLVYSTGHALEFADATPSPRSSPRRGARIMACGRSSTRWSRARPSGTSDARRPPPPYPRTDLP
jgi:hypothetical protein